MFPYRYDEANPIAIRRGGQTLTAPLQRFERTDVRLDYDPAASPRALRIRAGILRGASGT